MRASLKAAEAFPSAQWPFAKLSLTVARQRGICTRFPVPPQRWNARTSVNGLERTPEDLTSGETLTLSGGYTGVNE
jgi:hypothetical protein